MRKNATPRGGEADRVAARVQALLRAESDLPDVIGHHDDLDLETDVVELGGDRASRAAHHRPARAEPSWFERISARVPVRLDPGHRGALAVGVAVIVAALITGGWLVSTRPAAVPVSASVPSVPGAGPLVGTDGVTEGADEPPTATGAVSTGATDAALVIDVAGKVRHPGVYRLPSGSRVDDALRAAGGARGHVDLGKLNLAALLVDGQQVAVGIPAAPAAGAPVAGAGTASGAGSSVAIIDLNTATLEQLETLPGVGPVLGQDILDYRDAHGSFSSIEQLNDVSGIGDVTFGDLKSLVSV